MKKIAIIMLITGLINTTTTAGVIENLAKAIENKKNLYSSQYNTQESQLSLENFIAQEISAITSYFNEKFQPYYVEKNTDLLGDNSIADKIISKYLHCAKTAYPNNKNKYNECVSTAKKEFKYLEQECIRRMNN